jgi:transcriptional regulator with XRE-family HTH domain
MSTWISTKRKELGLSQGEVAAALGVSRPTYITIEKGERIPTPEQKAILAQILHTDEQKIEKYGKAAPSLPAVSMRDIPKEHVEKFKQTLLYVVNKVGNRPNIGQTALYKILYFIDFDYYEKFEEQLIGATYIKNTYGPTPVSFAKIVRDMQREGLLVEVKSKHFQYDQTKYVPAKEPIVSALSGQELQHIDEVISRLASKSARELSDLSHIDTPWAVARDKAVLNYEHVFYRPSETSVREYDPL